jgi:cellobiose transport system permease protein
MTSASKRLWQASPLTYGALILAALFSVWPIYYMFVVGTRSLDSINDTPPPFLPGGSFFDNFGKATGIPAEGSDTYYQTTGSLFGIEMPAVYLGIINSFIVSALVTLGVVLFGTLAGFAFAKLQFRGRNLLLLVILVTMMVPTQLGIIPLYDMMQRAGDYVVLADWLKLGPGGLGSVILPFLVSAFGVFLMRQYASQAVPDELIEAARVDGCSTFRIYWSIVLPALRPAAAVLGLLTFMEQWNSFLWPYAILTEDNPTVQVSLAYLSSAYYIDYSLVFSATAVATLPLIIIFIIFGRQIIGGIMEGAVKA